MLKHQRYTVIYMSILCLLSNAVAFADNHKKPRIVSLYSAYTEMLIAIGAEDSIVGTTSREAKKLGVISVGNHMNPSIEAVISCQPDFVIAFAKNHSRFEKLNQYLTKLNIQFLIVAPTNIKEVQDLILTLGNKTNCYQSAKKIVKNINTDLAKLNDLVTKLKQKKTVFVEVRQAPTFLTCGKNSIVADIIHYAGAKIVVAGNKSVNRIDIEAIIKANPDFYLQQRGMMNRHPKSPDKESLIAFLPCVQRGNFGIINEKLVSRPGINVAKAALKIYNLIYNKNEK